MLPASTSIQQKDPVSTLPTKPINLLNDLEGNQLGALMLRENATQ